MMRDIWGHKGTYIACIVIMSIGLMIYNVFGIAYDNIESSISSFYAEQRFADGFVEVIAMPLEKVKDLENIDEIDRVNGRLVRDVKVLNDAQEFTGYLRLIAYEEDAEDNGLNQFEILSGRRPSRGAYGLVISSKYAQANNHQVGGNIRLLANGQSVNVMISGTCRGPEFIYALRTDQDVYPDAEHFGIAYMPYEQMQELLASGPIVNDIVFTMKEGADFRDIKFELEERLKSYGLIKLYARKDQKSHIMLRSEVDGLRNVSRNLPLLFLGVAVAILIIMIKRLIEKQRGQIGVMKAFGFRDYELLLHYVSYAAIIGICGGSIGGILGNILLQPLMSLYQDMFNMPIENHGFSYAYFLQGMTMALLASLLAGVLGAKSSLALEPAEAMRPASPKLSSKTWFEKWQLVWKRLSMLNRIAIRNIFRNKGRSLFLLMGTMFTMIILGLPFALDHGMHKMMYDQFEYVMKYDAKMILTDPLDRDSVLYELAARPELDDLESFAEVPVELSVNGHKKLIMVIGLEKDSEMYHLRDMDGGFIALPDKGILLSERLAKLLKVKKGDTLQMKSPYSNTKNQKTRVLVSGVVPQYMGINAYMRSDALMALLKQSEFTTSILIKASPMGVKMLKSDYLLSSLVSSVETISDTQDSFSEMMNMMTSVLGIMVMIGMLTGFAIIYAVSMIGISERERELASMLVIGMSYQEVRQIVYQEQWYIASLACLLGLPVMKIMVVNIGETLGNDAFTIPSALNLSSVGLAILLTALSMGIAQWSIRKKIDDLPLVAALNMRE